MKLTAALLVVGQGQEICKDYEISNECVRECNDEWNTCLAGCNDGQVDSAVCTHLCSMELTSCQNDCPCMVNCPNGCDECHYCSCIWPDENKDYQQCYKVKELEYFECFLECSMGDLDCEADCLRDFHENLKVCPCQELCLDGCPCEQYDCDVTTTTSEMETSSAVTTSAPGSTTPTPSGLVILAMNSYRDEKSAIIDLNGITSVANKVTFNDFTDVYEACSLTHRGEMLIFGGATQTKQVSRVSNCQVNRIASLPFIFSRGGCTVFGRNEELMLCSSYDDSQTCHTATEYSAEWTSMKTIYTHMSARLASNPTLERILTVGSYREHASSEWFDHSTRKWVQTSSLYAFPTGVWVSYFSFISD